VIRRQFLVEAGVLGLAGGVAGAILGGLSAFLLSKAIGQPILVSAPVTIGAIVVAIAIGLVFGVHPASRAARPAPIDALPGA